MTDRHVTHATFTLERLYPASPARVFAAWADPAAKARWFAAPGGEHELDFRVGGREVNRGRHGDGPLLKFESHYQDIVQDERIVYSSTLHSEQTLTTVSLTTVTLTTAEPGRADGGTRLVLTEQGTYLDGHEDPAWRERGTAGWLAALDTELRQRK
ncbi:MAG TPA: SRPBCC domain-containing protein [Actinoallomurus sp.]|nr:SRPBCC domain-containing protein [Actinoallomurus sp.]